MSLLTEMDLWASEKARLAPQRARLVYGKVLWAYEMGHSVYERGLRAYEMVRSVYEKGLRVYEMVLQGPHGMVLRRAVVSVPRRSPPADPAALLRTWGRS